MWEPLGPEHWLGTDDLGRDLMSRLVRGARTTFSVAFVASVPSFALGLTLSCFAAVMRGAVDRGLSRLNDLMMSIPTLIFTLVVLAALPQEIWNLIAVMAVLDSTRVFRLGRAMALDVAVMDIVEAARLRGASTGSIVFREILPNTLTPLLAEFGLRFAFAVLFLSTLSFLGLGIQPPAADWGGMVKDNSDGISFDLERGRVLGLIGESAAGKSTIGLAALAYGRGGVRITGGSVRLDGEELLTLGPGGIREIRGARVCDVAQSAAAALNPAHRLGEQVIKASVRHGPMTRRPATARARELFAKLGLPSPETFGNRYPHMVSGRAVATGDDGDGPLPGAGPHRL